MKTAIERPRVLPASTLAGKGVENQAGEDLGKIEELMIDLNVGRVAYAVLSFGGFLGVGSKLFAVPWYALKVDVGREVFILNVDKEILKNAPGFDKDNWPDMTNVSWALGIHRYYGYRPYWEEPASPPLKKPRRHYRESPKEAEKRITG